MGRPTRLSLFAIAAVGAACGETADFTAAEPTGVEIRWPGGGVDVVPVDAGARDITIRSVGASRE